MISHRRACLGPVEGTNGLVSKASRKASRKLKNRNALGAQLEPLEARQLLSTLSTFQTFTYPDPNGGPPITYSYYAGSQQFDFKDARGNLVRIYMDGPVTAEFVAATLDENNGNKVTLGDLVPYDPDQKVIGSDLFAIYVKEGSLDSLISITTVDRAQNGDENVEPYKDHAGELRVTAYDNNKLKFNITKTMPANTGRAFLGARTKTEKLNGQDVKNSDLIPVLSAQVPTAVGLLDPAVPTAPWIVKESDGTTDYHAIAGDPLSIRPGLYIDDGVDLGKFLFAGTVTGKVYAGGSMNQFYAGVLLTGENSGVSRSPSPDAYLEAQDAYMRAINPTLPIPLPRNKDNFVVKGNLHDLVVKAGIGAIGGSLDAPEYLTQFEMKVDGRVSQVKSFDSIYGQINVLGGPGATPNGTAQQEIESWDPYGDAGFNWQYGYLTDATFRNNSQATAQYLGSITSDSLAETNMAQVQGRLEAEGGNGPQDWSDYYAVGLTAGQVVQVQLTGLYDYGFGALVDYPTSAYVGVFDPDGRLIATDYTDVDWMVTHNQPFRFTADRPGTYYFAIAMYRDIDFVTHGASSPEGIVDYELRIWNIGDVTLGGVVANNTIYDYDSYDTGINLEAGDLGAVTAANLLSPMKQYYPYTYYDYSGYDPNDPTTWSGTLVEATFDPYSVRVAAGDLRVLEGGQIGRRSPITNTEYEGLDITVPLGDVGLVRSTNGILVLNDDRYDPDYISALDPNLYDLTQYPVIPAIGGDYQALQSTDTMLVSLVANGGLGSIRAANMDPNLLGAYSVIYLNADLKRFDGIIDMIDVAGNFGQLSGGGPHITTGPRGNVRYINVGGTVYSDTAFGGGQPQNTTYPPGQPVTLNDDSGASITFQPIAGSSMDILAYGIRGSGGVAVIRATTNGNSMRVVGTGLAANSSVEVGRLDLGAGPATLDITGTAKVDVFTITGGDFTSINNTTKGEMVNMAITSVGRLTAETLGLARGVATPGIPQAEAVRLNNYPFSQQRNAIVVTGAINIVSTRGAMGNISAASINQLTADSDGTRAKGSFDGIAGPIFASGAIGQVNIGAGIASGGSGNLAHAGIFAGGILTAVRGVNADIRGPIYSGTRIDSIQLTNGSIINTNIMVGPDILDIREINVTARTLGDTTNDGITNPVFEIREVLVQGSGKTTAAPTVAVGKKKKKGGRITFGVNGKRKKAGSTTKATTGAATTAAGKPGGIIGLWLGAADIGTVKVTGGFGILNSAFSTPGDGVIERIEGDGYGLRDLVVNAGARLGALVAIGNGQNLPTTTFSASVRNNPNVIDPSLNFAPNRVTDLNVFLGTTDKKPTLKGVTEAGLIAGVSASASRDLDLLQAYRLGAGAYIAPRGTTPTTPGTAGTPLPVPSVFNFANSIKAIVITEDITDAKIVTGGLSRFSVGRDVLKLDMTVAGRITTFEVKRNFSKTSVVHAIGPNGEIGTLDIKGSMAGVITAQMRIFKANVGGKQTGTILSGGKKIKA